MPAPGGANNNLGINAFSGPLGEKEPAYGLGERLKVLSKVGVKPTPGVNAAKRAQRRATTGTRPQASPPPEPPQIQPEMAQQGTYDQMLVHFWTNLAQTPGASPLVQQIAAQVAGG